MKKWILILFSSLLIQNSFAADLPRLKELFTANFTAPFYQNDLVNSVKRTEKFIRLALSQGIDMEGALYAILTRVDERGSIYYPLYELRDEARFFKYDTRPGRSNKSPETVLFHDFLIADGYVFDFYFRESPTVLPLDQYAYEMLIPKKMQRDFEAIRQVYESYQISINPIKQVVPQDAYHGELFELLKGGDHLERNLLELIAMTVKNK